MRRGLGDMDRGWWKGCGSGRRYNVHAGAHADVDIDVHAISTFFCISSYCDQVWDADYWIYSL